METGYFRPGDALPKSAKRENAITEMLNKAASTGVQLNTPVPSTPGVIEVYNGADEDLPAYCPVVVAEYPPMPFRYVAFPAKDNTRALRGVLLYPLKRGQKGLCRISGRLVMPKNWDTLIEGSGEFLAMSYDWGTMTWQTAFSRNFPINEWTILPITGSFAQGTSTYIMADVNFVTPPTTPGEVSDEYFYFCGDSIIKSIGSTHDFESSFVAAVDSSHVRLFKQGGKIYWTKMTERGIPTRTPSIAQSVILDPTSDGISNRLTISHIDWKESSNYGGRINFEFAPLSPDTAYVTKDDFVVHVLLPGGHTYRWSEVSGKFAVYYKSTSGEYESKIFDEINPRRSDIERVYIKYYFDPIEGCIPLDLA